MRKPICQYKIGGIFRFALIAVWLVTMVAQAVPVMATQGGSACAGQKGATPHDACCCEPTARQCDCDFEQSGPTDHADPLLALSAVPKNPAERVILLPLPAGHLTTLPTDPRTTVDKDETARGPTVKVYLQTLALRI